MFLTDEEVADLTRRQKHAAQARVLRFMGIEHKTRPDGSLAVLRAHVEKVLGGEVYDSLSKVQSEPDWSAI